MTASALPTGTVTFLFTDIEGSTRLLEARPEAYRAALARHDAIVQEVMAQHGGMVFERAGDSFAVAFTSPGDAVRAAIAAQQRLHLEPWGQSGPLRVRFGLHTGEVELQDGQYFGLTLHRCARLMSCAHGGQILLSTVTMGLVRETLPPDVGIVDLGSHLLRDLSQPEHLYQLTAPGLTSAFPPLRTQTAIAHNLPRQATTFVGRERQVQAVQAALLRPTTRLLTLTGPGGTGKTRLALEAAANLLEQFPGGVFFVPLASVTDPDLVPSTVAQVLDVRESAGRPLLTALADFLAQREMLLILDNFEQVVDAAPFVAQLLALPSALKILVTSRTILRIYGEHEYPVPPLTLPDRRSSPSAAHLSHFEAVRLFVSRAQAARAAFALDDGNAPTIAEICHRLDGLPLAIELAAARIRALTPQAMLQRMERSLPLLTGGSRDLPARQQTLRGAIAWSYDLLEPDEQALFRRLGVFRGCTLEAIETVCAGEPPRPGATSVALAPLALDMLDGVASLVEKSLLRQEELADGESWYTMLETVREFAVERLEESGEADAVRRRQVQAALYLAESSEHELVGPRQARWFARLEREHDNFRSALRWSQEQGYAVLSMRLAAALWWFWSAHGHANEGRERVTDLLARFPLRPDRPARPDRVKLHARVFWVAGMLASMRGDHAAARAFHEQSLELRRQLGESGEVFNSLEGLGTIACFEGDYVGAEAYLNEALTIARDSGDAESKAMVLHALGNLKNELGDLDAARLYYTESLHQLPNDSPLFGPHLSIAAVALDQGRYDEAEVAATIALDRFRREDNRHVEALALATLGAVALARGDRRLASTLLSESLTIQRELGNVPGVAQVLERFVAFAVTTGRLHDGARIAGAADALRERGGGPVTPGTRARLERVLEPVRHALDDETFATVWRSGRALDLDDAIAAALAIAAPDTEPASTTPEPSADAPAATAPSPLSRREREVAQQVARGLTNRQIAEALVISEGTVANHVNHILTKLDFTSRAQIAAWAVAHGLRDD